MYALPFLIDLLAFDGSVRRNLSELNAITYYDSFQKHPLGVDSGRREFGDDEWPELFGAPPDFARILNLAFNQPTAVDGLDDVTGGLAAVMPAEDVPEPHASGLVTLVAGPPGSGKTTLCITISSYMAELGSTVRYLATEESTHTLRAKHATLVHSLTRSLLPDDDIEPTVGEGWKVVSGDGFQSLEDVADQLEREVGGGNAPRDAADGQVPLFLVFPRVIVIDSLTALLHRERQQGERQQSTGLVFSRDQIAQVLNRLRRLGVCVFLVGGRGDLENDALAYLVDNVFALDAGHDRAVEGAPHPSRTLTIRKTRLHASLRGTHVFHLSRVEGCDVSPSLHAVLKLHKETPSSVMDKSARTFLWVPTAKQLSLNLDAKGEEIRQEERSLSLQRLSHTLVYGRGPCGKANIALWMAFEPRINADAGETKAQLLDAKTVRLRSSLDQQWLERARVLVVSFLYEAPYYQDVVAKLMAARFDGERRARARNTSPSRSSLEVVSFYPGYIDPETLVARVRRKLIGARLQGRPFTAVVLDGIHNLLVQFPLLEKESLLWPTLFRVFRSEGVDTISTFTFFRISGLPGYNRTPSRETGIQQSRSQSTIMDRAGSELGGVDHLLFQLLISKCDYTFVMERAESERGDFTDYARVALASSVDGFNGIPKEFVWDPGRFELSASVGSNAKSR